MSESFDESASPDSSGDEVINDLMARRKLQQEALLKIITSIDKTEDFKEEQKKETQGIGMFWRTKVRSVFGIGKNQKK
jgi:hypothetical protein